MAEGGGLLNRYSCKTAIVGSNPIPSAILLRADALRRTFPVYLQSKQDAVRSFSEEGWSGWYSLECISSSRRIQRIQTYSVFVYGYIEDKAAEEVHHVPNHNDDGPP